MRTSVILCFFAKSRKECAGASVILYMFACYARGARVRLLFCTFIARPRHAGSARIHLLATQQEFM